MRVALYQCRAWTADLDSNLARLEQMAAACAGAGANLLVLPELYLTGYRLGDRLPALALAPTHPALARVAAIARQQKIALVLGYPELGQDGIRNVAALWDEQGECRLRYAKINLFGEQETVDFLPGQELTTVAWHGYHLGLLICYDVECPETVARLTAQGADLILAPTANMQPYVAAARLAGPARTLEQSVYLVYANYAGEEADLSYTGLSGIFGPQGMELARAGETETLLLAELPARGE
ncbi:nitrilase-related carbon-nitrogen hydrolase [Pseudaeromonas sp. ZJS20]|uniref:nitrilase-related carbon-nitrogen hydrolase n=1 Tax=Pseudaeromonas aegiceratis TaxID=3153928 RepID=UPI00390C66C8